MSIKDLYVESNPMISSLKDEMCKILFLGVPFDSTSTYRPGSRFAPNAIRDAFLNIESFSSKLDLDVSTVPINDMGNLIQIIDAEKMLVTLKEVISEILDERKKPIVVGGEHTISYASFNSIPDDTLKIIFDAHLDLRDEFAESRYNHATWLKRYIDDKGFKNIIHVGYRAVSIDEVQFLKKDELITLSTEEIMINNNYLEAFNDLLKISNKVYVSIDMDVLDPAYAPGVGNPEASGLTPFQLLNLLNILKEKHVLGFDVTEVCPPYDNGITSILAAKIILELTGLMHLNKQRKVI